MADKHIQAEKDYVKGMKYKEIAEKYDVSLNTVKSWKQRHGWSRNKGAPSEKSVRTKSKGGQPGNKNAKGNRGGAAPKGNQNAKTHGLFAKYLPPETLEIVNDMDALDPLDILWMSIQMKFASIMRAQQIMHVTGKDDLTKELKKEKHSSSDSGSSWEEEYELQFAWDKQANFLNSQSRAMSELRNMLKQFVEMADYNDYRLLEIKKMQGSIDKTKAEIAKVEAEAAIAKNKADKLTAKGQVNDLLKSLLDVKSGGDGSGSTGVQSETDREH
ncbi:phage terminase small subunit [Halalkalibacterium halodurans]|uniref:phage terminase small subunit n=1 Tax=Halalkalibacterium halodurans TaxID=86665 RepID=UPI0010FD9AF5|nr:phage terminase small subunit [Halalkalibacterium halodurans]